LLEPLVINDEGDSWGTGCFEYRDVVGRFRSEPGSLKVIEKGPVRTITESVLTHKKSRIVFHTIAYPAWPVLEFRLRVHWNEERAMLKLAVPTRFGGGRLLCEVPGGAIERPADGREHVFGRWAFIEGAAGRSRMALAVVGSGQHGLDFKDAELRISVLRSAAYCHERAFKLTKSPARKFMDQGVHEMRFLVTAGEAGKVRRSVAALADWPNGSPYGLSHLPFGEHGAAQDNDGKIKESPGAKRAAKGEVPEEGRNALLALSSENIRLTACKRSWDGKALVLRLHETSGQATSAELTIFTPLRVIGLSFKPFEIKTLRIERTGAWRVADLISEA
jgi:alpha-mannosidase